MVSLTWKNITYLQNGTILKYFVYLENSESPVRMLVLSV